MNKSNKILIVVLTFIVVCVVGYALFSETITVTGTATAQGSFDIVTTCQTGIDSRIGTASSLGWHKEGGFINDSCTVSGNTVSANAEFLYPGANRYYTIGFKNNGTIDAVLDFSIDNQTEKICVSDDKNGLNKRCYEGKYAEGFQGNFGAMSTSYKLDKPITNSIIGIDPSNNILLFDEIVQQGFYNISTKKVIIKPGYSFYSVYYSIVNFDLTNPNTTNKMYVDVVNTINLTFEQITVNDN